jgi:hypothetical protein
MLASIVLLLLMCLSTTHVICNPSLGHSVVSSSAYKNIPLINIEA